MDQGRDVQTPSAGQAWEKPAAGKNSSTQKKEIYSVDESETRPLLPPWGPRFERYALREFCEMAQTPATLRLKGILQTGEVRLNGKPLCLAESLQVVNHSPTEFSWSYGGSGPTQLALAVLLSSRN